MKQKEKKLKEREEQRLKAKQEDALAIEKMKRESELMELAVFNE